MTSAGVTAVLLTIVVFIWQSNKPSSRLLIMLLGTIAMLALNAASSVDSAAVLARIPWSVLILLATLNFFARVVGETGIIQLLAVYVIKKSDFNGAFLLALFSFALFLASSVVNNLTAILLCLPIVFEVLRRIRPRASYCVVLFGMIIAACNLGGAATAIGDFPAILLLSLKKIQFASYTVHASVICLACGIVVFAACLIVFRKAVFGMHRERVERELIERLLIEQYSGLRINKIKTVGAASALTVMVYLWACTSLPAFVPAIVGAGICALTYLIDRFAFSRSALGTSSIVDAIQRNRGLGAYAKSDPMEGLLDFAPIAFFFLVFGSPPN